MTTRRTRDEAPKAPEEKAAEVEKPRISALAEDLPGNAHYKLAHIKKVGADSDGGIQGPVTRQFYMHVTTQPFYVRVDDAKAMVESGAWEYGESQPEN